MHCFYRHGQMGKQIALPRTREENQMDFYYIDDFMQLKEGAFHVMEPMENCVRAVPQQTAGHCSGKRVWQGRQPLWIWKGLL